MYRSEIVVLFNFFQLFTQQDSLKRIALSTTSTLMASLTVFIEFIHHGSEILWCWVVPKSAHHSVQLIDRDASIFVLVEHLEHILTFYADSIMQFITSSESTSVPNTFLGISNTPVSMSEPVSASFQASVYKNQ